MTPRDEAHEGPASFMVEFSATDALGLSGDELLAFSAVCAAKGAPMTIAYLRQLLGCGRNKVRGVMRGLAAQGYITESLDASREGGYVITYEPTALAQRMVGFLRSEREQPDE